MKEPKRVREQVMVYLTPRDRELLERLTEETGLSRTELFRRGLWQMAAELLGKPEPGSAFAYLIDKAEETDSPRDLSERPDHYLYGSGYRQWSEANRKTASAEKKARRGK